MLEDNAPGLAFWTALGYTEIDRRRDRELGRPCVVLRKPLTTPASPPAQEPDPA